MKQHLQSTRYLQAQFDQQHQQAQTQQNQKAMRAFTTFLVASAAIAFITTSADSIPQWMSTNAEFWQSGAVPNIASSTLTRCVDGVANSLEWAASCR